MKTNHIILALVLIIAAAAYRMGAVFVPDMSNISPIMALAFCGAVYFRQRWLWLVPFAALLVSDLWINRYYTAEFGYTWGATDSLLRLGCFGAGLAVGAWVSRRRTTLNLLSGTIGCSLLFYLVTNSSVWLSDPYYAKTLTGWWQAMTVGHIEFPPTLWFFRNTLIGDLLFTTVFALVMQPTRAPASPSAQGTPV